MCYGMGCKRMWFCKFVIKDFFGEFLGFFFFYKRNILVFMIIGILFIVYYKSYICILWCLNFGELI